MTCKFTSWYYIINKKLFKTVEWLRKNYTWKIKRSYWLRLCQGLCFSHAQHLQNDSSEQYKKTFPEKSNDQTFQEIKKTTVPFWVTVSILQKN